MSYTQPPPGGGYPPPQYQPAHAPQGTRNRNIVLVTVAVSAALVLGYAAGGVPAPAAKPGPAVTVTVTAPAAARPPGAAGPAALAERIAAWYRGAGGRDLRGLPAVLGGVAAAARSGSLPAVNAACAAVETAVANALAAPPVPDAAARHDYALALAHFSVAATRCQDGVSTDNAGLIRSAASATSAGTAWLALATARVAVIGKSLG